LSALGNIGAVRYFVIGIDLSNEESLQSSALEFIRRKDQLDLEKRLPELPLRDLLKQIPPYSRVLTVFSGNQVLSRYSSGEPNNLFEEVEEEDFYFQKVELENGWAIASACRKSTIDPVLDILYERKLFVLHMAFDPAAIPILADLAGDSLIGSGHFNFQFRSGELQWIMENPIETLEVEVDTELLLEGMSLAQSEVSLLAGLIDHLKEDDGTESIFAEQQQQCAFYRKFRSTGIACISVLFLALLCNFLLFGQVQNKLHLLESSGASQAEAIQKIEGLKTQIEEYQGLSLNLYDASSRSYSFYLEELAKSRPSGVWFNQMQVDPIFGKQEEGKSVDTDRSRIKLKGETHDPVSLNRFVGALKSQSWVEDIELVNYELSGDSKMAVFELIIRKSE